MSQMTNKEIDELLGISKWTRLQTLLGRRLINVGTVFIIYCVFVGVAAMGWKLFWTTLVGFALIELTIATISHYYYGLKLYLRRKKRSKNEKANQ
ncbi:MAG: hypothetical protein ACRDD7_15630 [Peptostreptococcaceae bacterium]